MAEFRPSRCRLVALVLLSVGLSGCAALSSGPEVNSSNGQHFPSASPSSPGSSPAAAEGAVDNLSLYERRLRRVLESERAVKERAMEVDDLATADLRQQFQRVASGYESIMADNPGTLEPVLLYAKFLDWFGDREGAHRQFLRAYQIEPAAAVVHQQLGVYFAEEGEFGRALAYYLRAIELEPEEPVYHIDLGELLHTFSPGLVREEILTPDALDRMTLEAFRTAARLEPENLLYQYRLGEAYYDVDTAPWEEALAHWETLVGRSDLSAVQREAVRLHRSRCLHALKRFDEAEALALEVQEPSLRRARDELLVDIRVARGD